MNQRDTVLQTSQISALETNKVLRNTYMLLGMSLAFSALTAMISMMVGAPRGAGLICSIAAIAIIWFVIPRTANSEKGIFAVFAFMYGGARAAKAVMVSFYIGEVVKVVLTAVLFYLVCMYMKVDLIPFLLAYSVVMGVQIFSPVMFVYDRKIG